MIDLKARRKLRVLEGLLGGPRISTDMKRVLIPDTMVNQNDSSVTGTLAWHVADASGATTTIRMLPGTYKVSTDTIIPKTINIINEGGVFTVDRGVSLTFMGLFEAGNYLVFEGEGDIFFGDGNPTLINVYWWFSGTKNQDDEYAAFTSAINSLGIGCSFIVPAGDHYTSDTIEFNDIFRCTIYWYGRLRPYDTFDDYLLAFSIVTGAGADPEIAGFGNNFEVIGHIRLNCLNDDSPTLQQARGVRIYGVYMTNFPAITVLGSHGTAVKIDYVQENYFQSIWAHGCKNRYAFSMPSAWSSGTTYTINDYVYRNYDTYAGGTTYSIDDFVTYSSKAWRSLQDSNTGNTPANGSDYWEPVPYEYYKAVRDATMGGGFTNLNKDPQGAYTTNQLTATDQYWQRVYRDEALLDMVQGRRYGSVDHQVFGHIDFRLNDNLTLIRMDHAPGYETAGGNWTEPSDPTGYTALTTFVTGQLHAINSTFDTVWGSDRSMTYPQQYGTFIEFGRARRTRINNFHVRPGYQEYTVGLRLGGKNAGALCYAVSLDAVTITDNGTSNVGISAMPNYYGETEPGRFDVTFNGMAGSSPIKYRDPNNKIFSAHGQSQHLWYDHTGTIRAELGNTDGAFSIGGDRGAESLRVVPVSSADNFVTVYGANGAHVQIGSAGADANIDMLLNPKGSGVVWIGTHTALGAEALSGYITIKDAAGNSRKIAVIS